MPTTEMDVIVDGIMFAAACKMTNKCPVELFRAWREENVFWACHAESVWAGKGYASNQGTALFRPDPSHASGIKIEICTQEPDVDDPVPIEVCLHEIGHFLFKDVEIGEMRYPLSEDSVPEHFAHVFAITVMHVIGDGIIPMSPGKIGRLTMAAIAHKSAPFVYQSLQEAEALLDRIDECLTKMREEKSLIHDTL